MRWESANACASTRRWITRWPGVVGIARLEAAVDVVATFVEDQPPGRLLDLEPGFAHEQMAQALPMLTEGLMLVLQRCAREDAFATAVDPRDVAGAIARTALSHYIFPDSDGAAAAPADPRRRWSFRPGVICRGPSNVIAFVCQGRVKVMSSPRPTRYVPGDRGQSPSSDNDPRTAGSRRRHRAPAPTVPACVAVAVRA